MIPWLSITIMILVVAALEFVAMGYFQYLAASDEKEGWFARLLSSVLPGILLFLLIFCGVVSAVCWWFGVGYGD
jgi:hypothetical protein